MTISFLKPERIWMQDHPELNEAWIQKTIAEDPSILGLGDLELLQQERRQPRGGRLDLLLRDPETVDRYEVEIQLGATDESHIIRTIEYWDIERKQYPQYDHTAVIVAEEITSRFFNVISLFNYHIPLIAIQLQAFKVGENMTLVFTTILDEFPWGLVEEDEIAVSAPTDRAYWEDSASPETVGLADQILKIVQQFDPTLELKYNKRTIGLQKNGYGYNFVDFIPRKMNLNFRVKLPKSKKHDTIIEEAGVDDFDYKRTRKSYQLAVTKDNVESRREVITELSRLAYERYSKAWG